MRYCAVCKKKFSMGSGTLFRVPKDPDQREIWSRICGRNFSPSSAICTEHFAEASIIRLGTQNRLMTYAEPLPQRPVETVATEQFPVEQLAEVTGDTFTNELDLIKESNPLSIAEIDKVQTEKPIHPESTVYGNAKSKLTIDLGNIRKVVMPPQLEEEPIIEIQAMPSQMKNKSIPQMPLSKSLSCTDSKEPKTHLCGVVENFGLSEEFRLNCFYCSEVFPLENWKFFVKHLREKHFEVEERFKTCEYVSEDNNHTSITSNSSHTEENALESPVNSSIPPPIDPLDSTNLSFSLKIESGDELEVKEECEPVSIEIVQQKSTEIAFEYTPHDIINSLLDAMKKYPILWQFDDQPFNEDFYEAVEDVCKIINDKWSLNIDNLKMRRSINRILRFYCYLYPNDNIEHIDQFTCYYDKCATFLPESVKEIAYARCSHCYICFQCDFDLKPHLLEEHKYLQWPYKCLQCKECFLQLDEYEFHKCLPHYDENFRCAPCNKSFFRRNIYTKHLLDKHRADSEGEYQCDVCEKVFKHRTYLRNHKLTHGERKHNCHICPKSFLHITSLRIHLKRHRRQYDLVCEICGQKLFNKGTLRVHMKRHTQEKITCNICNLKLRKSSLNRHLQLLHVAYEGTIEQTSKGRHLNYRRLVKSSSFRKRCKICKMSFENYELAIEHKKEFHPDISKWSCKICVNDFTIKRNLKRHYRRSHKLEPFQVNKLVDEDLDLNLVLSCDNKQLDEDVKTTITKTKQNIIEKSAVKEPIKSDFMTEEIYFEGEKIYSSKLQDEIMNAADSTSETDDFLIEFLAEENC